MQGLDLDEDHILQDDCFEGIEAEEEYEGYMGNSVGLADLWTEAGGWILDQNWRC